jgi:hypothetical protein
MPLAALIGLAIALQSPVVTQPAKPKLQEVTLFIQGMT